MIPLFENDGIKDFDVLAIQEPWKNPYQNTTNNRLSQYFDVHYMNDANTRVCFFINKKLAPASYNVTHHSKDLVSMTLRLHNGRAIHIHNVYNPCRGGGPSTLPLLDQILKEHSEEEHLVVGDFNLHHPKWGGMHVRADAHAYDLITMAAEHRLKRTLPRGTITWSRGTSQSTIDLAFVTPLLRNSLIESSLAYEMDNNSDHYPIQTIFDLHTTPTQVVKRRNYEKLDLTVLLETLTSETAKDIALTPDNDIYDNSEAGTDRQIAGLTDALRKAIDKSTPFNKICSYSKPGFTEECKEASCKAKRLKRLWQRTMQEEDWVKYTKARNRLGKIVKKAMKKQFRKESADGCESSVKMWSKCKWARSGRTPQESCIPALYSHPPLLPETDPKKKADILMKAFFPPPPEVELEDTEGYQYEECIKADGITLHEIEAAIAWAASKKAPGGDEITNIILKKTSSIIAPHLHRIYNACLDLGYCPEHFRESVTIALRKPGKSNYQIAGSYRPIALLNTISKIMEFILAKRISYMAETMSLLPRSHFGARKAVSIEHALHYLVEKIISAWNRGKLATLLLLDVTGAFDNVSKKRLLHNLRLKRIEERIVRWIDSFLSKRTTILKTSEHVTERQGISIGTPQGSPLSPILFLFYNAPLLEELTREGITNCGFVDDVALLVEGDSSEETVATMINVNEVVCQPWARSHGVKFNPRKYQLCHMSRSRETPTTSMYVEGAPLIDGIPTIKAKKEVIYLGTILDSKLNWKAQINANKTKAQKTIGALSCLAGSTWGARFARMRQMMQAVFMPQLTYSSSVWYTPHKDKNKLLKTITNQLATVVYKAERKITGAFRATSRVALNIETHTLPIQQRLKRINYNAAIRLATSSVYEFIIEARSKKKQRIWTPLEILTKEVEKKTKVPFAKIEKITPFVTAPWWIPPKINIMPNKKTAEAVHKTIISNTDSLIIYSDGSGINGKVGAAAVSPDMSHKAYLGPLTSFTVYSGELFGMTLALGMILKRATIHHSRKVILCIDNQAAIRAIHKLAAISGQQFVKVIVWLIDNVRRMGYEVQLHWVPAHIGIAGNEAADIAAKQATGWRQKKRRNNKLIEYDSYKVSWTPKHVEVLKSAQKQAIAKITTASWCETWANETRGRTLHALEPKPRRKILNLHDGLDRELSSIAIQMRTGKIGLRYFLFKRKVKDIYSPKCPCGQGDQTVEHVLFACRRHREQRKGVWSRERGRARYGELRLKTILTEPVSLKKAAIFMKETGLIGHEAHQGDDIYSWDV